MQLCVGLGAVLEVQEVQELKEVLAVLEAQEVPEVLVLEEFLDPWVPRRELLWGPLKFLPNDF